MTMEAGVLLDRHGLPLFWHKPADRSSVSLPDSSDLWSEFWSCRDIISGFAHSHPGGGTPHPSTTDLTTFAAVEAGLGLRLFWWITSEEDVSLVLWTGPDRLDYYVRSVKPMLEPGWVDHLRHLSNQKSKSGLPFVNEPEWSLTERKDRRRREHQVSRVQAYGYQPVSTEESVLSIECPECKTEPGVTCYPEVLVPEMVCLSRVKAIQK